MKSSTTSNDVEMVVDFLAMNRTGFKPLSIIQCNQGIAVGTPWL
jgi:hypothetical protein